jgi:hypothetical protein
LLSFCCLGHNSERKFRFRAVPSLSAPNELRVNKQRRRSHGKHFEDNFGGIKWNANFGGIKWNANFGGIKWNASVADEFGVEYAAGSARVIDAGRRRHREGEQENAK